MKFPSLKSAIAGLLGLLAINAHAQIGSGWSSIAETFKIQTSGSGSVNGDTFKLTSTSSGTKDRAEREYNAWSSGTHQFQGDVTVTSLGGDRICLKQTFQENSGPWNMVAVQKSGHLYEVEGGNTLANYTVGTTARINTILDASHGTVQVYINGVLVETKTGGKTPIYDKLGTYRTDSGTAPITATWTNVQFWQGGTSSGGGTVSTPTFSPAAGTYTATQTVSIASSTSGASIRYTTDGSTPSETAGTVYSGAISISTTTTLNAIAYKSGSTDSSVATAVYTINPPPPQVAAPTFSPAGGTYATAQSVSITTTTAGASIHYTTDGSTPSETAGTFYSGPVSISITTTLKAIAYEAGFTDSTITSATYTFGPPPTLNFEAESLSPVGSGATVSISNDANASGGVLEFLNSTAAGQTITFTTPSIPAGTYQVQLRYKTNTSRGQHSLKIDGTQIGSTLDQYATTQAYLTKTFGNVTFASAGTHSIAMTVTGKNSSASQFYITADKFTFVGQ